MGAIGKFIDLTGQRFGKLTVVKRVENYTSPSGTTCAKWECKCDCGNTIYSISTPLRKGRTKSCGCYHKETIKKAIEKSTTTIDGVMVARLRMKKKKGTSSKYKGVYYQKTRNKWCAEISIKNKTICLGSHDTEEEAHQARVIAEKILHRPFILKEGNIKKENFLIEVVGFSKEEAEQLLGSEQLQNEIKKALEIIKAS